MRVIGAITGIAGLLFALAGLVLAPSSGIIATTFGCFLAISARICQASVHHDEVVKAIRDTGRSLARD